MVLDIAAAAFIGAGPGLAEFASIMIENLAAGAGSLLGFGLAGSPPVMVANRGAVAPGPDR